MLLPEELRTIIINKTGTRLSKLSEIVIDRNREPSLRFGSSDEYLDEKCSNEIFDKMIENPRIDWNIKIKNDEKNANYTATNHKKGSRNQD